MKDCIPAYPECFAHIQTRHNMIQQFFGLFAFAVWRRHSNTREAPMMMDHFRCFIQFIDCRLVVRTSEAAIVIIAVSFGCYGTSQKTLSDKHKKLYSAGENKFTAEPEPLRHRLRSLASSTRSRPPIK